MPPSDSSKSASSFKPSIIVGLTHGGDTLGKLQYQGGGGQKVTAGGTIYIGAGLNKAIPEHNLSLQLNLAYHFDNATAKNADVTFDRYSLEFIPFYHISSRYKFGLGVVKILSPEVEIDFYSKETYKLESDLGYVAELGVNFKGGSWVAVRYAMIDYTEKSSYNQAEIDGNYLGVLLHWVF